MDILINSLSHMGGGGRTVLENVLPLWDQMEHDHRFRVLVRPGIGSLGTSDLASVTVEPVDFWTRSLPVRLFFEQCVLPIQLLKDSCDVLFCTGDLVPLASPVPTVLMVRNSLVYHPGVETARTFDLALKFRLQRLVSHLSIRRARRVIFVSEWIRDFVTDQVTVPPEKSAVVHHGIDPKMFQNGEGGPTPFRPDSVPEDAPMLLAVSTVNPHKNFEVVIRALACPEGRFEETHFVIAGRTPDLRYLSFLRREAQEQGVDSRVHFLGKVPYRRMPGLYAAADVFVCSSRLESFGHPLLEAMAAGVPVVASDAAAITEIVGEAGLFFDPDDPDQLAEQIQRILNEEEIHHQLIKASRQRVRDFPWERTARRTLNVLEAAGRTEMSN